jgi:hypothetical protein
LCTQVLLYNTVRLRITDLPRNSVPQYIIWVVIVDELHICARHHAQKTTHRKKAQQKSDDIFYWYLIQ